MSWVAVGVAVVGTAASAYSAYSASNGSGQSMPTAGMQLGDAKKYASYQAGLDQDSAKRALELYPEFAQQQLVAQQNFMKAALAAYPGFAEAERDATSLQRHDDLRDFRKNAGGWESQLEKISPAYAAIGGEVSKGGGSPLLDYLNAQAFQAGPSALRTQVGNQALYDLSFGGSLSPEEERMAQQSSRAAWSDRGLVNSNPAIADEVLSRDYLSRQRLQERMTMAINAQQIGQSEDSSNRAFGTGVQAQNEAATGNYRNWLLQASQAQVQPIVQASMTRTPVSPYGAFGASGAAPSPYGVASLYSAAPQIAQGVQAVQPLYMTDFAAAESRANAGANAIGAIGGGLTKSASSIYATGAY